MKHLIPALLLCAFMTAGTHPLARGTDRLDTLRVTWVVGDYRILDRAQVSDEEGVALLSRPLHIDQNSISFDGKRCEKVTFQRQQVDLPEYLRSGFAISPQDLGVTASKAQLVRTSCDLPGFSEYLHLPDRKILVFRTGVCLVFSPWVNY